MKKTFTTSFSGGKDSTFALYLAKKQGFLPVSLINMLDETGERSRSHGLKPEVLRAQAASLGLPLITRSAGWGTYEVQFVEALREAKDGGATLAVFGDVDLIEHKEWEEKVCVQAEIDAYLPIWGQPRIDVVHQFVEAGFVAQIMMLNQTIAPDWLLGEKLTHELIEKMVAHNIDPCAESGEFHTVVLDGPIFQAALKLDVIDQVQQDHFLALDLCVHND